MRIKTVHIRNFRCLEDVEVEFDDVTSFIGPNGAGKSTVLRSLEWFFNGEKGAGLTEDDVFAGASNDRTVSVTVTFDKLTDSDRAALTEKYAPAEVDRFSATRTWNAGEDKTSGVGKVFPPFNDVRAIISKTEKRKAYTELSERCPQLSLPMCRNADEVEAAMLAWENGHPNELQPSDLPSTHFFGFNGRNVLSGIFDFVFVSADLRASEQSVEGRKTVLGRIVERTLQKDKLDQAYKDLAEDFGQRQSAIHKEHLDDQLAELGQALSAEVSAFTAGRQVQLRGVATEVKPTSPAIHMAINDAFTETSIDRQGHGFQRALLIGALKLLAERREGASDGSVITLAIEEPELYQHPTQARVFANVLRELAEDEDAGIQVAYATHNPTFVSATHFDQVRRVTRDDTPGAGAQVIVRRASMADVQRSVTPHVSTDALVARWDQVCNTNLAEAIFSNAAVLVEGVTDKAIIQGAGSRKGIVPLENRGIAVAVAGDKLGLFLPHAILRLLGIPTLVVFDNDSGSAERVKTKSYRPEKDEAERAKMAEDEERKQINSNRKLLEYFDQSLLDYPTGEICDTLYVISDNLEEILRHEWPAWESARNKVVEEGRGAPKKNSATYEIASRECMDEPCEAISQIIQMAHSLVPARSPSAL